MKFSSLMFLALALSFSFASDAMAALDLKSKRVQNILCARMQREIATDDGHVVSIKECRENGEFVNVTEKADRYIVDYQSGGFVEDSSTICEVEFAKDKKDIKKLRKATCDLA